MDRRNTLLALAGLALFATSLRSFAQQGVADPSAKTHRVGLVFVASTVQEMSGPQPTHPGARAFIKELSDRGYEEGRNLIIERRSAEGRSDRFAPIIAELIKRRVDVLVLTGDELPRVAKQATTTIPIVLVSSRDPTKYGLITSYAHPGGNVTGTTTNVGPELEGKRLELLKALLPKLSRVAYIGTADDWNGSGGAAVRDAAHSLGVQVFLAERTVADYERAFAKVSPKTADALFVANSSENFAHRMQIVGLAAQRKLPDSHAFEEAADDGGFMGYGVSAPALFRHAAIYVDKILKGANPAELPVEQPTTFELALNLKTAKALGIKIPHSVLQRASRVIQ